MCGLAKSVMDMLRQVGKIGRGKDTQKPNMEEQKGNKVTGQGFGNPVPPVFGSGQAKVRPSLSHDRDASVLGWML